MFRDCGTTRAKIRSDIANCTRAVAEEFQDLAASRVSDGPEQSIFFFVPYCNHLVTKIVTEWLHVSSRGDYTGSFRPRQSASDRNGAYDSHRRVHLQLDPSHVGDLPRRTTGHHWGNGGADTSRRMIKAVGW
jgi:hypothetical protein